MEINSLLHIPKFTPLDEVFKNFGNPKFKLGDRNVYYLGNGILISYSSKKFRVKNSERIEYGNEGQYALILSFFMKRRELEIYFKLKEEKYEFESDILGQPFKISDDINMGDSFDKVSKLLRPKSNENYYGEYQSRVLKNGKFVFDYKYINYGNYTFLFFGESNKTELTAFEFKFKD